MQAKTVGTLGKNVLTRSGWSEAEEELLRERLSKAARDGTPLREVFDTVAIETGRKPNSVRNYYYTAMRCRIAGEEEPALVRRERSGFTPFTDDEIGTLLRDILTKQAQGMSVRACAMALGGGDRSQMLRFQNKYRSLLKNRRVLVEDVMRAMEQEGVAYVNPYGSGLAEVGLPQEDLPREGMREWLDAFEEEAGVNLVDLANSVNALVARLDRESATSGQESGTLERYRRKLQQLSLAVRDYLTTRDTNMLGNLRLLVEECEGMDGRVLN